ncbi:MAG: hypothetical protein GXO30_07410 [Epsilonproteobacteria bacterium]|nr:hypothetical protein [Campylobacterota bacterium]
MIVIVIMGVVYKLALVSFSSYAQQEKELTLKSLKEFLKATPHNSLVKIACYADCSKCRLIVDDNKTQKELDSFIDEEPTLYRYDPSLGLFELPIEPYFEEDIEKDTCFSYTLIEDVGEQIVIKYHGKYYDFTPYVEPVEVYDSVELLLEAKANKRSQVVQ